MNLKFLVSAFILAITLNAASKPPIGLNNVGNSCFMNAALQCLTAMSDFTKHIATNNYYKDGSPAQLYKEFLIARNKTSQTMTPSPLANSSWKMLRTNPLTQQDADEFLTELLRHIALDDIKNEHVLELVSAWKAYPGTLIPKTPANNSFIVQLESQLTASAEDFLALQSEPLGVIGLPINPGNKDLRDCLDNFFAPEEIKDYVLPSGNKGVQKKLSLEITGQYLLLTLKRNEFRFGNLIRHENALTIPLSGLDLSPYFSDKAVNKEPYELIGMIMHGGSAQGGHYTAYVKDEHQWYYCNDRLVTPVSAAEMNQIASRGYGASKNTIPTTLVYELSSERAKTLSADTAAKLLLLQQAAEIKNQRPPIKAPQPMPKIIKQNSYPLKKVPEKKPSTVVKKNAPAVPKKSIPVKPVIKKALPVKKAPIVKKSPLKVVAPAAKKQAIPVKKTLPKPVAKVSLKATVKKTSSTIIPKKIVKK